MVKIKNSMDLKNIAILVSAAINLCLGFFVFIKGKDKSANRIYGLLTLGVLYWSVGMVLYRFTSSAESSVFLCRVLYVAPIFIVGVFLYFSYIFPLERVGSKKRMLFISVPACVAMIYLVLFTDLTIRNILLKAEEEKIIIFGSLYLLYAAFISGFFFWAYVVLLIKWRKSEGITRVQVAFVFLGTFLASVLGMITNLLLPTLGIFYFNWLGQILSLVMSVFIAYAIVRHHLLNIKIIAIEIFAAIIPIVLLVDIAFSIDKIQTAWRIAIFLLVVFFSYLLIISILKELKSQEQLKAAKVRLEKALKAEKEANIQLGMLDQAKTEFLNLASHQLRTPVSVIKGISSMMKEDGFDKLPEDKKKRFAQGLLEKSEKLESIIDDILDASEMASADFKADKNKSEEIDVKEFVKEIVGDFEFKLTDRQINMKISLPENPLPVLRAQKVYLKEALENLVDNAIKYTPSMKADSEARDTREGGAEITFSVKEEGESIVFSVKDNGIGIPQEETKNLFKKFQRAANARQMYTDGSGLGLYIAKEIIEGHGGKISVQSREGEGTIFSASLPKEPKTEANIKKYILQNAAV